MKQADVVLDHRLLACDSQSALVRISMARLRRPLRVQLLRMPTGASEAFSVYLAYGEGPMTFEASASLSVPRPGQSPAAMLRELVDDPGFVAAVLLPLVHEVDRHFGRRR